MPAVKHSVDKHLFLCAQQTAKLRVEKKRRYSVLVRNLANMPHSFVAFAKYQSILLLIWETVFAEYSKVLAFTGKKTLWSLISLRSWMYTHQQIETSEARMCEQNRDPTKCQVQLTASS